VGKDNRRNRLAYLQVQSSIKPGRCVECGLQGEICPCVYCHHQPSDQWPGACARCLTEHYTMHELAQDPYRPSFATHIPEDLEWASLSLAS
jgi:hypothetical protein